MVQRQMVLYWTRLAKTGDPNGPGNPDWPAASGANDPYLEIGAATAAKIYEPALPPGALP